MAIMAQMEDKRGCNGDILGMQCDIYIYSQHYIVLRTCPKKKLDFMGTYEDESNHEWEFQIWCLWDTQSTDIWACLEIGDTLSCLMAMDRWGYDPQLTNGGM